MDDNEHKERSGNDRREKRRNWWWLAIPLALLVLWAAMPDQPESVRPDQVSDRRAPGPSTPQSTPIRGSDVTTPENSVMPTPGMPEDQARLNARAENAAASVDGVRTASAIVTNTTGMGTNAKTETVAFVGVTLESSIKGAARESTLSEVAEAVRDAPGIDRVAVTDDPELLTRIKRVAASIADGRTSTQHAADLRKLTDELLSKAK